MHNFGSATAAVAVIAIASASIPLSASSTTVSPHTGANALLAIDENRSTVVDRIVSQWGDALITSGAGVTTQQLREMLYALRADHLLAASLAGTLAGLRDLLAMTAPLVRERPASAKALGDAAGAVVYTPVTPCRLVETRGTFSAVYQGGGAFTTNQVRNYTIQGGNGVCLSQLPAGLNPTAIQVQVFGMPTTAGSGDLEILPQGSSFGSTATMVYIASIAFNTVSTTAKVNLTNNQISVQVRGGGAHVAIDVVGYFKTPRNGDGSLEFTVSSGRALRLEPDAISPSLIGGNASNSAASFFSGQTVAGGGYADNDCYEPSTGQYTRPCTNRTLGGYATVGGGAANVSGSGGVVGGGFNNTASFYAVVPGGSTNTASGTYSFAAGTYARADANSCVAFSLWGDAPGMPCFGVPGVFNVGAPAGASFDYFSQRPDGGGFRYVAIGRVASQTISTWTGAFLTDSGVWVNASSSKARKTDFAPVDGREVLARVARLPITTWRYKEGEGAVRHMGPMAEDFDAAFGIGYGPQTIADLDARGVALAAIQGLNAKLEDRIAEQQREIVELRRMLVDLRGMLDLKGALH
jgi:hypothetical protein